MSQWKGGWGGHGHVSFIPSLAVPRPFAKRRVGERPVDHIHRRQPKLSHRRRRQKLVLENAKGTRPTCVRSR